MAYILEKGRGFRKIYGITRRGVGGAVWEVYPLVPKIYRPYAVLWFGNKKEGPFLFLGKISKIERRDYVWVPEVEEEEEIPVVKVGNWRIIILKGLSPGKYTLSYQSPKWMGMGLDYLFEVAQEPEESQQKDTSEAKEVTKEAKDLPPELEQIAEPPPQKVTKEAKDPIALLKSENSNAEISVWKEWAIIRYPVSENGDMTAQILKWENNQWKIIASTTEGFRYIEDVKEYIPNLSEEGAKKLGLSHK
jgi:hypothetical protein